MNKPELPKMLGYLLKLYLVYQMLHFYMAKSAMKKKSTTFVHRSSRSIKK